MSCTSCERVLPILRDYVDRELDVARAETVERHLASCPSCAARVQAELELKQALRSRVRVGPAPAGLSGQILRTLRREEAREGQQGRFSRQRLALAGAVGQAAVAIGSRFWQASGPSRLTSELIDDHIRYLVSAVPAEAGTADPRAAENWLEGQLNLAVPVPQFGSGGPRLLGARRCYVLDRQVALLFYDDAGSRLSLFAMDGQGLDLAGMSRVDMPETECAMESYKGYHIVGWKRSGLLFALVGRGPREALVQAARTALRP